MGQPFVQYHVTRERFEEIRRNLHSSDNHGKSLDGDKARKGRPIISHLNYCYQHSAVNGTQQSIDEHVITFVSLVNEIIHKEQTRQVEL